MLRSAESAKLAVLVLIVSMIYALLVFDGLIDCFIPTHIIQIEDTVKNSYLNIGNRMVDQLAGFYVLGAIIKLLAGVSSFGFLVYPIQMVPFLILFFVFFLKLSNSYFISSIMASLQIISGTTGTAKIFFWPHGIGCILYFTLLLILYLVIVQKEIGPEYRLLLIISGISLIFISYDFFAIYIITLFVFIMIIIISLKVLKARSEVPNYSKEMAKYLFIIVIAQLGLSKFVYQTFIPLLDSKVEITGIEKFFIYYFQKSSTNNQPLVSDLLINYSQTIAIISIIKYIILILSIMIFLYLMLKKYRLLSEFSIFELLIFTFLFSQFFYGLIRLHIGGEPISWIYFPGILCIIWLHDHSNWKWRSWAKISIALILILTFAYTFLMNSFAPEENVWNTDYIKQSSNWYLQHKEDNVTSVSDELTKQLFQFYIFCNADYLLNAKIIKYEQLAFLLQLSDEPQNYYYLINYKINKISIQNWRTLKSWRYLKERININDKISKIFDVGGLSLYK